MVGCTRCHAWLYKLKQCLVVQGDGAMFDFARVWGNA